jgi:hypothetical protein
MRFKSSNARAAAVHHIKRLRVGNARRAVQSSFRALPVPSQGADAATPIIEEQLTKAGVGLAMVLNRLWP